MQVFIFFQQTPLVIIVFWTRVYIFMGP